MTALGVDQVRAFRLARQRLDRRAPAGSLLDVVGELCGVHAQLASSAELALWARVDGLRRAEVRTALEEERSLVKTWAMRGTLHLVTPELLGLLVAVLGPSWDDPGGAWLRGHGVPEEHFHAIVRLVPKAVGARPLTREELADRLAEAGGPELRERLLSGWGALLKPSAQRGELCFGPERRAPRKGHPELPSAKRTGGGGSGEPGGSPGVSRGRVTFVRPDRWLGKLEVPPAAHAEPELARRFLRTYGPANADDFARWAGMRGARPKRILASLGDEAVEVEVDGRPAYALRSDLRALRSAGQPQGVRLLPAFDPFVVGTRPREHLVARSQNVRVYRAQGWISPVVLVDGVAAGVWKHQRGRVELDLFGRVSKAVRAAIDEEAERLRDFVR